MQHIREKPLILDTFVYLSIISTSRLSYGSSWNLFITNSIFAVKQLGFRNVSAANDDFFNRIIESIPII